jgi:hypothetical protein
LCCSKGKNDSDKSSASDSDHKKDKKEGLKLKCQDKNNTVSFVMRRSLTDCWFIPFWISGVVAMFCCAIYGWAKGDPSQMFIGWDSDKNGCGYSDVTKQYGYLYWPQLPGPDLLD